MNNNPLRVAVVGVGHLGQYHLQKYLAIPDIIFVGAVDINPERLKEITTKHKVRGFRRHQDIINLVDAVSIAVPTEVHFDVAMDFLKRGIHILIEKPITYDIAQADILLDKAKETGAIVQVGLVERFNPAVIKMKSLVKEPIFFEAHRMNNFTPRGTDVDVVLDLMIHDIDIILDIVGDEIVDIHAVGMSVITDKIDIANARLVFKNGIAANLTASRVSGRVLRKIRVFQPDSYISADYAKRRVTIVSHDKVRKDKFGFPKLTMEKVEFPDSDPLADEIISFVNSVKNRQRPVVSGYDGRKALEVALQIIDEIKSNSKELNEKCLRKQFLS